MSLLDLLRLCKKYWVILLAAALVCGVAGFAFQFIGDEDSNEKAIARVVANSQTSGMTSLGHAAKRNVLNPEDENDAEYDVSISVPSGQTTLKIQVTGPDGDRCIEVANAIATETVEKSETLFANFENPWIGYADLAVRVEEKEPVAVSTKHALVGFLAGLFVALCAVLLQDLKKRSVKSLEGMQDAVEIPVLEKLPAKNGERLLANVRFASGEDNLDTISVVPLSAASAAGEVCGLLNSAFEAEGSTANTMIVEECKPLSDGMDAAYQARKADAVLVVAKQWDDSLKDLETTVAELKLADAKLVGLVYAE